MSILFVLLMFLLVMSISYFRTRNEVATQFEVWAGLQAPRACSAKYGFSIPDGDCFRPGHTWVLKEAGEMRAWALTGSRQTCSGRLITSRWLA